MRSTLSIALGLIFLVSGILAQPEPIEGYWVGDVSREGKTWRVEIEVVSESDVLKARIDFVDLDVSDVQFPVVRTEGGFRLEKPQPSGNPIGFDGKVDGDRFVGDWKGFGVSGKFDLKRSVKPQMNFREEEVAFKNGDINIAGTLLLPMSRKPTAAVVITHGSSPNERSAYRSWAKRFADAGIAALIYDKRGSGKSTGNTRAASMEDLADDAVAGVRYLASRKEIDAKKIGVAGHSQGGWIAPLAGVRSKEVAFVIASAAAGVTPAEQSIYHRAEIMRLQGITEDEIKKATELRAKLYDLNRMILSGTPFQSTRVAISQELAANSGARWFGPAELPPQLAGELPPPGALRLLFFDPNPMWGKLRKPVYVVWGDKDTVVPVIKSKVLIESAQRKARNKSLTTRVFNGVDHSNNIVTSNAEWDFPRASTEIEVSMAEWVVKVIGS